MERVSPALLRLFFVNDRLHRDDGPAMEIR